MGLSQFALRKRIVNMPQMLDIQGFIIGVASPNYSYTSDYLWM